MGYCVQLYRFQFFKLGLLKTISLERCPRLTNLLHEHESVQELMTMSPEALLLRWVNYHLERSDIQRRCTNFTCDITDSVVYFHLIQQIAPHGVGVDTDSLLVISLN